MPSTSWSDGRGLRPHPRTVAHLGHHAWGRSVTTACRSGFVRPSKASLLHAHHGHHGRLERRHHRLRPVDPPYGGQDVRIDVRHPGERGHHRPDDGLRRRLHGDVTPRERGPGTISTDCRVAVSLRDDRSGPSDRRRVHPGTCSDGSRTRANGCGLWRLARVRATATTTPHGGHCRRSRCSRYQTRPARSAAACACKRLPVLVGTRTMRARNGCGRRLLCTVRGPTRAAAQREQHLPADWQSKNWCHEQGLRHGHRPKGREPAT